MSSTPKNVLTVIAAPHWGGLQVVVERTTPLYADAGFRRYVAQAGDDETIRTRLEAAGCKFLPIELRRPRKTLNPFEHLRYARSFYRNVQAIEELIKEHQIDVVEAAGLLNLQPAIASLRTNTPLVWQMHSTLAPAILRRLIGRFAARASDVVMTSGAAMIAQHGGLDAGSAEIVPFCAPIDLDTFRKRAEIREIVRKELGYTPEDVVIGTLGNRTWQKRHDWVVRIAAKMRDPKLQFALMGSSVGTNRDYYRTNVLEPINDQQLRNVRIIDQKRPASEMLNALDVFILPSVAEGASLVTAEAMACSLPIVASNVGSLPDIVHPGENGFLCNPSTIEEFCDAIEKLTDASLREAQGKASRALAESSLGTALCADSHFNAYRLAIAAHEKE